MFVIISMRMTPVYLSFSFSADDDVWFFECYLVLIMKTKTESRCDQWDQLDQLEEHLPGLNELNSP